MRERALASHPLARLIHDHRKQTGETYAQIAARGGMATSTVNYYATNDLARMPERRNLVALAKGLGLESEEGLEVVTSAAQTACGFKVYKRQLPNSRAEAIMVAIGELDEDDLEIVAALVDRMRRGKSN